MIEESVYNYIKFIERPQDDLYTLEIIKGPYKDVKFQFGAVSIKEDDRGAMLSFNWTLIEGDKSLEDSDDFKNFLGDTLRNILEEEVYNIGRPDVESKHPNNNIEESTK